MIMRRWLSADTLLWLAVTHLGVLAGVCLFLDITVQELIAKILERI